MINNVQTRVRYESMLGKLIAMQGNVEKIELSNAWTIQAACDLLEYGSAFIGNTAAHEGVTMQRANIVAKKIQSLGFNPRVLSWVAWHASHK